MHILTFWPESVLQRISYEVSRSRKKPQTKSLPNYLSSQGTKVISEFSLRQLYLGKEEFVSICRGRLSC